MLEQHVNTKRVCFVVESGTDVRLVEGLAERFALTILARRVIGGFEISWPSTLPHVQKIGPSSRLGFAWLAVKYLLKEHRQIDFILVQGYGLAALATNLASRLTGTPTAMLVCSPVEDYYKCRKSHPYPGKPFRLH